MFFPVLKRIEPQPRENDPYRERIVQVVLGSVRRARFVKLVDRISLFPHPLTAASEPTVYAELREG